MPSTERLSHGTQPPPVPSHPLPRRSSPENSVTLRHHRLARDASLRASPGSTIQKNKMITGSSRRNSSGDSHATGQSDPKKWFDLSNQNPTATFDNHVMDVDPPFFQKESDSSNEEKNFSFQHPAVPCRLVPAQSSSADDYRSVIDDLTVEIQKLKEQLKRYKQSGPDMLRKDKLFEIKIHGLPKRKRRELESTLRDFAATLKDSPGASSSQRKNPSRHATRDNMYSASGSASKHPSSSSGSNARPVDSAYASMSTGAYSGGMSHNRPPMSSRVRSSEQKVQNYLRDIPEGLYPRHMAMTEREKKRIVVRRLEQLFTGKIGGRHSKRCHMAPATATSHPSGVLDPVSAEGQLPARLQHQPPNLPNAEPAREARIVPLDQQHGKKSTSRDNGSASHSNGDQTESGGNGNSSGSGLTVSPSNGPPLPEQRPTRPKDLDPDRVQVPSENMNYIRHLGLVPPELLADTSSKAEPDVHPDAEGWVYLNLLCNLAQLHIINVTPNFVRSAVSEMSTKFQLSPDGRKIRWRGGSEGTRFSSDSSRDASQKSPDTDDTISSNKDDPRKRQKTTGNSTGDGFQSGSGSSSKNPSKFGPQVSGSSESFHYKPLFVQQLSPNAQTSNDDTLSSFGPVEDSNVGGSRWELSGSGTSNRRKRRRDGAIIYYSGAPFCTDLSGEPGDVSPATHMRSSGQERQAPVSRFARPLLPRSASGSSLCCRPLSDGQNYDAGGKRGDAGESDVIPGLTSDSDASTNSDVEMDLGWSDKQQLMEIRPLEPCGLGGVLPDDHFLVVVTTKRPTKEPTPRLAACNRGNVDEATDGIIHRLATMSTSSPVPITSRTSSRCPSPGIEIEYMSGRINRLRPVPLPPPAIFFPPFSTDSSSNCDSDAGFDGDDDEFESSEYEESKSRKAPPHQSNGYPDDVDLSSGDEDGEEPEDEPDSRRMYDVEMDDDEEDDGDDTHRSIGSADVAPGTVRAGAAGSSAAYHLAKYARQQGVAINTTIFEKTDHIGGRTLTVGAYDDASQPVELGASIFVSVNHILYNATRTFGLPIDDLDASEAGDVTVIWDGEGVVFSSVEGSSWWWEAGRLWWRYGMAPYRALKLVRRAVSSFLRLYEEPYFPFPSLNRRVYELGLDKITAVTGEQFLAKNKINVDFTRHLMQPATRVNYASNLAYIHGLEAMVSFSVEGAMAVLGGNWQIFNHMVRSSGATIRRNTSVTTLSLEKGMMKPGAPRKYVLSTKETGGSSSASPYPVSFDNVIIATPWQFSEMQADAGVLRQQIDEIPYMKLHVTLFTSPHTLRPEYFNLEPGSKPPSNVYTTLGKDEKPRPGPEGVGRTGFYSISTLRRVRNPKTLQKEFLYKIFSAEEVTPQFLSDVLGSHVPDAFLSPAISWYYPHWFYSYPIELPRVTFQDPVVGRGLFYTSGIESFISTMETSALMGMNVARLVADGFPGMSRRRPTDRGRALREDFFQSVESEVGVNMYPQDELMFVLRNVGKLIFGSSAQESLIDLPQGQLYLVRPLSPKGYSELIFKDAAVRIRRTNQDFHYQLVVQRVFEEGEAELLAEEEGEEAEIDALEAERDEKTFLLDEALHLRIDIRESGEKVLAWRDLSGDTGDLYEFVCDADVPSSLVERFIKVARECQFERKYRRPHSSAFPDDLRQFEFVEEPPIPPASPLHSPTLARSIDSVDDMQKQRANSSAKRGAASEPAPSATDNDNNKSAVVVASTPPTPIEIYATVTAELHLFDPQPGHFALVDDEVIATVSEVGKWEYWLQIDGKEKSWLGTPVVAEFNPVFDFEYLSFVFNHFGADGTARSWLLRFKDQPTLERFQQAVMQAIWEQLNETKWAKIKEKEREYVLDSFGDLTMEDAPPPEEDARGEEEEEEDEEEDGEKGIHSQVYDSEDDEAQAEQDSKGGEVNSQLAVGYKHDRSFVVRGSKIGVFSHTPDNRLKFSTNISKVTTPSGRLMSPKKVMLHSEDRDLIMQNDVDPNKLFRMDIEYGKVVDEWKVHDDIPVVTFAPENKFAQMTSEQTFLGVSGNALYRIDPRLSGNKLVDSDMKQYASKNDFSALATTEKGYIAVASNKGDIRLFDRLGIRAKTQLPALGDAIIGMDVSADGRWILGTTKNYLLLVDAKQKDGKHEGKLGFEQAFPASSKPQPKRLALTPEHVAQFYHETGKPVSFTPAKFNAGEGAEETSIITATGPYIVEWNLRRVLQAGGGARGGAYRIKRYEDDVKADDFKFGSDKNVIVALPNEVNMVAKRALRKPTRESIVGGGRLSAGGRKSSSSVGFVGNARSGRYKLGKEDIVNSPY
ncbi:hypothetical protein CP532_2249 [Ophiocordyceps camponoti-leonardi (nom. inval.)]|nr:hypothetical protein CP532_2249 [Ophiocordyceps camponoti-leonardi (nom. inval.)]